MDKYPKNKLKLLYIEILQGYSSARYKKHDIFIKHFTNFDIGDVDLRYEFFLEKAKEEGLPTYKEKEDDLIKTGLWDPKQNDLLFEYKKYLENIKITKSKCFKETDINHCNKNIEEFENKIKKIEDEKNNLIQFTAENFTTKKIHEYYIFSSLFQDQETKIPFFSQEDFDELNDEELNNLTIFYNHNIEKFSDYNLQRIALFPAFFNFFCLTESAYEFFGKPIINLSLYQAQTFGYAKYFKSIIQNAKTKPPENLFDEPDKLIEWHESQQNVQETLNKAGAKDASSLMGLTAQDKERLGIKDETPSQHTKLVEMAKNKGSELSFSEIMKAIG